MKKILIIFAIVLSSCASAKHYDYAPEGKQPVKYKHAHKERHKFVKIAVVSFLFGYFIVSNNDTSTK